MKTGEHVVYQICIAGIRNSIDLRALPQKLNRHGVPAQYHRITPPSQGLSGAITAPRLLTQWRGDEDEARWQNDLVRLLDRPRMAILIQADAWTPEKDQ